MEELSLDNIVLEDNPGLFNTPQEEDKEPETPEETKENKEEEIETTEVDLDKLDDQEKPESVSSNKDKQGDGDTSSQSKTSPHFYSSIANALVEEGIFQNLDEDTVSNIKTAEDFAEAISTQIQNQLDERQKRIDEALNAGIEPTEIQKFEKYLSIIDDIDEESLTAEDEDGENIRKNVIYQDFINRGFSKERAAKEVNKSIEAGTDVEDAKEALQSNKAFFTSKYKEAVNAAKEEQKEMQKQYEREAEKLKDSIFKEEKAFGELELDKATRQKVYDTIMKPIYTNSEGRKLTAIQKYEAENKPEFLKNLGLVYVLTDGFKNLDGLVKGKVKKEVKKGLRELENTINNTSRTSDGNLNFAGGNDKESKYSPWVIDI